MFDKMENLHDKAFIAFLAQTGQRVGVLAAIKHDDIIHVGSHGVVEVPPNFPKNKQRVRYKFVIGEDTMGLLKELQEKNPSGPSIFQSQRQMGRIVDEAAREIGIQKEMTTRLGRKMLLVHPHTFRKYWKKQVREPLGDSDLVNCMMGHKPPYRGAYDHFNDNTDLVERYKKSERNLRIKYTQETLCPKCGGKGETQCDTCAGRGLIA
ncbi:tyrosine-type recombinase/integrase [Candidatus Bathyarchaeota archaeon]|nr:tyrosine-type recombinase/integrase [Candidatus Bathyarchaeota archaeon]